MRLLYAYLAALAISAQAAYIPITPRSEALSVEHAGEARAFAGIRHVMPRSGSGGHGGAALRKVRRLKRGRTCRPRPSNGSAFASPTATASPSPHATLLPEKDNHHKSHTSTSDGEDGASSSSSASSTSTGDEWGSWLTTTDGESAKPSSTSTGDQWSASSSQSSSTSTGDNWSSSAVSASSSSSSASPTETGSGAGKGDSNNSSSGGSKSNNTQPPVTPGDGGNGLFPVAGIKLFTTAKRSSATIPGWQLNQELPSEDYDPKTFDDIPVLRMQKGGIAKSTDPLDASIEVQKALYPAGQIGGSSGWWYYSKKDIGNGIDISRATDVTFSYRVFFPDDFDWTEGGKLPGLYGGTSQDTTSCSGGNHDSNCFSARIMWRAGGAGELYNYFQERNNYCDDPNTVCDIGGYGDSVKRGAFHFQKGQWNTVAQRLILNSVSGGQAQRDGTQELYVNGQKVITNEGIIMRHSENSYIYGLMLSTFFGGSSDKYRPPKDEQAYFKDWTVVVSKEN